MKIKSKLIIFFILSIVFIQCKSHEFQANSSDSVTVSYMPTLVIDSCIVEHQYEGKDSKKLKRIEITEKNQNIPQWAFAIVPTLEEVKLDNKVKIINNSAFFSCKKLEKINLNHVESIGENCFKFSALKEANLAKVTIIKEFAFADCHRLRYVEFSDKLKIIGDFAFYGDSALVDCHIPAGDIGTSAFMGCKNLELLSLGKVVSIGNASFFGCTSLKSVVIPSTVREIGNGAFSGCKNLVKVIMNSRNTKIAKDAFDESVLITYK